MSLLGEFNKIMGLGDNAKAQAERYQQAAMQQAGIGAPYYGNALSNIPTMPGQILPISGLATTSTLHPTPVKGERFVLQVNEADNGYIVYTVGDYGEKGKTYIAANADELAKVIALALVNRKLDEVK